MTEDRWRQVKALFESTVERPPEERAAFLAAAVRGDEWLRREVQSLLDSDAAEISVLEKLPRAAAHALGPTNRRQLWTRVRT